MTVRPWSATAAPAACRSRRVSRARLGIWGSASVNVMRGHAAWRQRQRSLVQVSSVRRPAIQIAWPGVHPGVRMLRADSAGRTASGLFVGGTRASIGLPSSPVVTETTATPSRPNRPVVSLVKPVAFSRSSLSRRLGRGFRSTGLGRRLTIGEDLGARSALTGGGGAGARDRSTASDQEPGGEFPPLRDGRGRGVGGHPRRSALRRGGRRRLRSRGRSARRRVRRLRSPRRRIPAPAAAIAGWAALRRRSRGPVRQSATGPGRG